MTIKGSNPFFKRKCKPAINETKLDKFGGCIIGIDFSIFAYKAKFNGDLIGGITKNNLRLLKNNITPIYVFDGKPPKEKGGVLQYRREKKNFMKIKKIIVEKCLEFDRSDFNDFKSNINDFIDENSFSYYIENEELKYYFNMSNDDLKKEIDKISKRIIYISHDDVESCKILLDLFGIKYIQAECEAESLIAMLCKNNLIDGCISEDSDFLANGGSLLLRNFSSDKNTIEEYCLKGILDCLDFSYEKFLDFCILCGSDYTPKINGLGPITAYKIMNKCTNIEDFLTTNNKYIIPENFDYIKARDLFKNPITKEVYDTIDKDFKMVQPKIELLKEFIKTSKLKDKYYKIIDDNLINYYLNIDGMNQFDYKKKDTKIEMKITDYYRQI